MRSLIGVCTVSRLADSGNGDRRTLPEWNRLVVDKSPYHSLTPDFDKKGSAIEFEMRGE